MKVGLLRCIEIGLARKSGNFLGHRLKSASNKTAGVFKALNTRRRVILSGTPIQNDLGEFHAMVSMSLWMYRKGYFVGFNRPTFVIPGS